MKGRSELAAPFVAGIEIENVGENLVTRGFETRREPQHELVIARRRLGDKDQVAFDRPGSVHLWGSGPNKHLPRTLSLVPGPGDLGGYP